MDSNDVYDYDKSIFFRLVQSAKHRLKFEFTIQHQGVVVCPLMLTQQKNKRTADLIDSHLFVPSPFYKNHYIPLISLIALSNLNNSSSSNNNNNNNNNHSTNALLQLPLDHSQQIHLILSEEECSNDLYLMNCRRRICQDIKLLSIQTAFTENFSKYKILIISKQLVYNRTSSFNQNRLRPM
jgi:hypothetical protein